MNIARTQLDGFFQQIVDGANHRRATRKVAQALDVVFTRKKLARRIRGFRAIFAKAAIEHDLEILDRSNRDLDVTTEHDFGGALGRPVGRIGNGESRISVRGLIGEDRHLPQKPLRERLVERRRGQELLKCHVFEAGKAGRFVGKIARRQVGQLPKPGLLARGGRPLLDRLTVRRSRFHKMVVATQMLQELQGLVAGHRCFQSQRCFEGARQEADRGPLRSGRQILGYRQVIDPKHDSRTKRLQSGVDKSASRNSRPQHASNHPSQLFLSCSDGKNRVRARSCQGVWGRQ